MKYVAINFPNRRLTAVPRVLWPAFLLPALWLAGTGAAFAGERASPLAKTTGTVVRVVDGDTVWVRTVKNRAPLKVRLLGIDAPEICQAGGKPSRDALKARVMHREVELAWKSRDGYGRVLATLSLQGSDMSRWMVSQGHAWSDGYRYHAGPYAREQAAAQLARHGLFADKNAETPRSFRKRHGGCYS